MLSLEQIRSLESKVTKAVTLLASFQEENKILKSRLSQYETRIEELEFMIEEFKEEQGEIEQGIISALEHLDSLENAVGGLVQPANTASTVAKAAIPAAVVQAEAPSVSVQTAIHTEQAIPQPTPITNTEPDAFTESEPDEQGFKSENHQLDIF